MKTNNTYSRLGKRMAAILAVLLLLSSLAGCLVPASKELREFWKAENGYNADVQNSIDRYGGLCVRSSTEYADGSTVNCDSCVSEDGIVVFVDDEEGWYYIRYEDEWYNSYLDDDGDLRYEKYAIFDEDFSLDAEYANPGFIFCDIGAANTKLLTLVDRNTTLVKNEDGSYIWSGSYDFDNGTDQGTAVSTIHLNADCEITETEVAYYLEDGSVLLSSTEKFTPGTQNEDIIPALAEALEETNGQTHHLTYNAVKDGVIIETFEADVPQGFDCHPILPPQYYDEEDHIDYFSDVELTQECDRSEPYGDTDIYFSADAGQ